MPVPRNKLLARLHCLKKELGLDDDAYRGILQARTGQRSASGLSDIELARVVAALGEQKPREAKADNEWAWVNTAAAAKRDMLWKIRRICINLGVQRGQQIAYAEGAAARALGCERYLKMMSENEIYVLVGALQNTLNHKRRGIPRP